jgi:hypothetical protein
VLDERVKRVGSQGALASLLLPWTLESDLLELSALWVIVDLCGTKLSTNREILWNRADDRKDPLR